MKREAIEAKLREFIDREVLQGQGSDLTSDTPLLELGILDSFSLFLVINYIAEEFRVELKLDAVGVDNFRNIASIASAVLEKTQAVP
jgi:acyl carrier protein